MAIDPINELDDALANLSATGRKTIRITRLRQYLSDLRIFRDQDRELTEPELAEWRAKIESNLAEFDAKTRFQIENYRASWAAGGAAMKAAMLINGAAAIALLAFLGNLSVREGNFAGTLQMSSALLWFSIGVVVSALAPGMAYLASLASA